MSQKRPIRVGVLTFGDGREFLQGPLSEVNARFTKGLREVLEAEGMQVVEGEDVIWRNDLAEKNAKQLRSADVDVVVFNYAVWAWPQYSRVASQILPQPIIQFSNVNPRYPGLVGMLAASGSLAQADVSFFKTFGDTDDAHVRGRLVSQIRAVATAHRLRGQTFGLFGGRSLGIDTAVADPALWMKQFGIDVDHVDQMELVRRAGLVAKDRVEAAFRWCEKHVGKIEWADDSKGRLTPDLLKRQISMYYAAKELCAEFGYDFCGIKGQRELTEHYATADIAEAFLNDPYDFDGPKDPIVCSTEADMDAALTMQVFHLLSGEPSLFADVRHYFEREGVWDLCNSGNHATYFAGRSHDPRENLPRVSFKPQGFYFPAGGAAVYHIASPGKVTLGRFTRCGTAKYRLTAVRAEFMSFGSADDQALAFTTQDNWPHALARLGCSPETFVGNFHCNHIHGTYGDWIEELRTIAGVLGVEFVELRD